MATTMPVTSIDAKGPMKFIIGFIVLSALVTTGTADVSYARANGSSVRLDVKMVCMMNDQFMGTEQIPVQVGDKTYYGCCQGCVTGLKNDRSLRYATDPYSGKEVDKASAYIVKKSDDTNEVYYFESLDTFLQK